MSPFPEEICQRIRDALEATEAILRFTANLTKEDFVENDLVRAAAERKFEIVGEALNQASRRVPNLVDLIPDLPMIIAMRNRIIHGYDRVDCNLMWDVIHDEIPSLHAVLGRLLSER